MDVAGVEIESESPLMEAGVDSLGSAEIVSRLNLELSTEFPATLLFDHPTLNSIAACLEPPAMDLLDRGPPLLGNVTEVACASPEHDDVLVRREDGRVVVVTYNQSRRSNAMDRAIAARLGALFPILSDDEATGAIIVTASGPYFCTGAHFESLLVPASAAGLHHRDIGSLS